MMLFKKVEDYGLKKKWLAVLYAVFTIIASFGIGNMVQANSVAEPIQSQFGYSKWITGLVAMLGPFIDTIIVCTMTALVIIISGVWDSGANGAVLTSNAFNVAFVGWGSYIVSISISVFAFTTLVAWSYYGDRSVEYLFGESYVKYYKVLFVVLIPVGAIIELKVVWTFSDIANALMALPNLIAVIMLSGVVAKMTKEYFSNKDNFKVE